MIDTTTSRLVERAMTSHRLRNLAATRQPAPPRLAGPCRALALGPGRNLVAAPGPPGLALLQWYDPCPRSATHHVTVTCGNGHALTWGVCAGCAAILACHVIRSHPHCPLCRRDHLAATADLAITPPVTPAPPGTDPGCDTPGCPARRTCWACHRCGDAYFGTPPDHGLCPACTTDPELVRSTTP